MSIPYDAGELQKRATAIWCRNPGRDIPNKGLSDVCEHGGEILVRLANVRGLLAYYKWNPEKDSLRPVKRKLPGDE